MLDISESGKQIGEKLSAILSKTQLEELSRYILENEADVISNGLVVPGLHSLMENAAQPLTVIQYGDLYFCLEQRLVSVQGQEIELTAKEFDIFALLIMNPRRVLTYDMIIDLVWHENLDYYSHRAISNHVSNLRRKLRIAPEIPDYIRSVHGIGYKFNPDIKFL